MTKPSSSDQPTTSAPVVSGGAGLAACAASGCPERRRDAPAGCRRRRRAAHRQARRDHAGATRRGPTSATTRQTPRCCWHRAWARRRARWPSVWARSSPRTSAPSLQRFEVAGPGFVNLFVADDWLRRGLAAVLAAARVARSRRRGWRRAGDGGIRLGQPDRADARRPRAKCCLRRRARAHARARRRSRGARVLRQRRGLAGAHVRRVDPGARARRAGPRGRLPGRLRGRARRAHRERGRARRGGRRPRGGGVDDRADKELAGGLRRRRL